MLRYTQIPAFPGGIRAAISWSAIRWLEYVIRERALSGAIDLGSLQGGSGVVLGMSLPGAVISCDIEDHRTEHAKDLSDRLGIIFEEGDAQSPEFAAYLLSKVPARRLVFCDNGAKEIEAAVYSSLMAQGDVLAVHDYGTEFRPERCPLPGMAPLYREELEADQTLLGMWVKQ